MQKHVRTICADSKKQLLNFVFGCLSSAGGGGEALRAGGGLDLLPLNHKLPY
jgi:hypothetical protein